MISTIYTSCWSICSKVLSMPSLRKTKYFPNTKLLSSSDRSLKQLNTCTIMILLTEISNLKTSLFQMYLFHHVECQQTLWFRMGYSLWLKKKDLLRHFWLCSSLNSLGQRLRYECGFVVFGSDDVWATDRQGSILPHEQERNSEEDFKRGNSMHYLSRFNVSRSGGLHLESGAKES